MKSLMIVKFSVIAVLAFNIVACNNKVDAKVPDNVKVQVENSTQTVNVVHTIELSVQFEDYFRKSCAAQIDSTQIPEPQRSTAIDDCVSVSVQNFIGQLMNLVSANKSVPAK